MTNSTLQFGTAIATKLRQSSVNVQLDVQHIRTIHDLLTLWQNQPPKQVKMLRSTCSVLSTFLDTPVGELLIDTVSKSRTQFRTFMEGRKYAENSIRTYVNHVRIMLADAKDRGWVEDAGLTAEWSKVLVAAEKRGSMTIVNYFAKLRKMPSEVTLEDVQMWAASEVGIGRTFEGARDLSTQFWRSMRECGYTEVVPLSFLREKNYGIPIADFPAGIRNEVLSVLEWKTAEYSTDRPKDARIRPVTAVRLSSTISMLYGFAVNIKGEVKIESLSDLVQKSTLDQFAMWSINHRKVKGRSIQLNLRLLGAVFAQHPSYASVDMSWFKPWLDSLPKESESEAEERKAEKYLKYSILEAIPKKLRGEMPSAAKKGVTHVANLAAKALLMGWLTILPWRQKNLRQCRISGPKPNLFKAKISEFRTLSKPNWVIEAERLNKDATFWQFKFSHEETKMKNVVHALLPRQLIGPLEEYLKDFRPSLVAGADPNTLFLSSTGKIMSQSHLTHIVSTLTLKYGGRRVTPHIFRDIVAYTWLSAHPEDYLTVSKLLWHTSINTTLKVYGARFNESSAVVRMEAWLDQRENA